jgi:hypothetical protein
MEHASRSKDTITMWPAASFDEGEDWVESASGPPNHGLRVGLSVAFADMAEWYSVSHKTEEDRLLAAIYALSDMLQEGNTELSWLIAEARHKGVSWVDVAGALGGLTRQAAHRRFAPLIKERLKDIELGTAR